MPKVLDEPPAPRPPWRIAAMLGLIAAVVLAVRALRSTDAPAPPPPSDASAAASSSASSAPSAGPRPPRCADPGTAGYAIGDEQKPRPADADGGEDLPEDDAPFAVEVGKGTTFDGGFAVGALRDADGGTLAMIATVAVDGTNGKQVKLFRARGDLDPPVVAGAGASVLVAGLEPNAGGRAVKIAKVTGDQVAWGPEFQEGKDESMATDLASSGARAAVAWDDMAEGGKVSAVFLASFDTGTLAGVTPARAVSRAKVDSDTPRLVARPGGFWLGWLSRGAPDDKPKDKKDKPKKPDADENGDEVDTDVPAGEAIEHRWVEVVPLDESGAPSAAPRPVTAKDGNVLAFDLKVGEDGAALVAYRDDDTPTGSSGGRLGSVLIKPDGATEPHPFKDDVGGVGAPAILPGWLALSGLSGRTYLAALGPRGDLLEPLEVEAAFGNGEPLAAKDGTILVARPTGKSIRLVPLKCSAPAKR